MATTAILRSRDCLLRHSNSNFTPPFAKHRRRLRRFQSNGRDHLIKSPKKNHNLVMGQVKILKRGEALPSLIEAKTTSSKGGVVEDDLILCSTGRLGPDPETVQKEIKASDLYAGVSPFAASPPPSSLPFPAFFSKKDKAGDTADAATSDLRRLLKLEGLKDEQIERNESNDQMEKVNKDCHDGDPASKEEEDPELESTKEGEAELESTKEGKADRMLCPMKVKKKLTATVMLCPARF